MRKEKPEQGKRNQREERARIEDPASKVKRHEEDFERMKGEGNGWNPRMRRVMHWMQTVWKLAFFLLITMLVGPVVISIGAVTLLGRPSAPLPPGFLLFVEVGEFAVLVALTLVMSLVESRPFGEYGLPWRDAFAGNFWVGLLLGLAEASVLIGLILILGGYWFGTWALHGQAIVALGLLHLVLFIFVGLYEEFLFRGYAQFTLSKLIGFWPAAAVLSVGFGLVHLYNQGEDWVGALSVALVGLLFAFALKRSGNLWYAVGLHAGFDWGESFLYSVPDSGEMLRGHLSNAILQGPHWLTGGSAGPEGSVFCFVTLGLQFLVVMWLFPAKKNEVAGEAARTQNQGL